MVVLCVCLSSAVGWDERARKVVKLSLAIAVCLFLVALAWETLHYARRAQALDVATLYKVPEGLKRIGIKPGDKMAVIGNGMYYVWPRLVRVRIVAEMPEPLKRESFTSPIEKPATPYSEEFWSTDEATKERVMQAFKQAGARFVVATSAPPGEGWLPVEGNKDFIYFIE